MIYPEPKKVRPIKSQLNLKKKRSNFLPVWNHWLVGLRNEYFWKW